MIKAGSVEGLDLCWLPDNEIMTEGQGGKP